MVDVIFINKVHEENLKDTRMHRSELIHALQFQHPKEKRLEGSCFVRGSALHNEGLDEVYEKISDFISLK